MARSKSEKRRLKISKKSEEKKPTPEKDEGKSNVNQRGVTPIADSEGVKYRLSFLVDQKFKGRYYRQGEQINVPVGIYKAYKGRSSLKFEQI